MNTAVHEGDCEFLIKTSNDFDEPSPPLWVLTNDLGSSLENPFLKAQSDMLLQRVLLPKVVVDL